MPGAVGKQGPPPDLDGLKGDVTNCSDYSKKVVNSTAKMLERVTALDVSLTKTTEDASKAGEELGIMVQSMGGEVAEEIEETALETCKADFTKNVSPCCPDCKKAAFKVPSKKECADAGCGSSCAYVNATCDSNGKEKPPCLFPFKLGGKQYSDCITDSPFGEVERPWCVLDTEENRAAEGADASKLAVGFCDCPKIKCLGKGAKGSFIDAFW